VIPVRIRTALTTCGGERLSPSHITRNDEDRDDIEVSGCLTVSKGEEPERKLSRENAA